MKTVLILVLSCNSPLYTKLMDAQARTWGSLNQDGVSTVFYSGDSTSVQWDGNWLKVPAPDNYKCIGWKTKMALEEVFNTPWDYLFRTNSSSYVCKKRLLQHVQGLPESGYYGGCRNYGSMPPVWVSGAGMILSRDVAELAQSQLSTSTSEVVDDIEIGQICWNNLIQCDPDYPGSNDFHFRCRPSRDNDRHGVEELIAFDMLFENKKALYL